MLTKYTETELRAELEREIDRLRSASQTIHPAWVTHTICKGHLGGLAVNADGTESLEPVDVAFWRFCGYAFTRKIATTFINDLAATPPASTHEPCFPGFPQIQREYVIRRDGVDVVVPTEQMSIDELRSKATQLLRNSVTLADHAYELQRYATLRAEQDKAAAKAAEA